MGIREWRPCGDICRVAMVAVLAMAAAAQQGGVCSCGPNAVCRFESGMDQYECKCADGYEYRNGVCAPKSTPKDGDSCKGVNCGPDARCNPNTNGNSYTCECSGDLVYSNTTNVCGPRSAATALNFSSPSKRPPPSPKPSPAVMKRPRSPRVPRPPRPPPSPRKPPSPPRPPRPPRPASPPRRPPSPPRPPRSPPPYPKPVRAPPRPSPVTKPPPSPPFVGYPWAPSDGRYGWCNCGPNALCNWTIDNLEYFQCKCVNNFEYYMGICVHKATIPKELPSGTTSCTTINCGPNATCDPKGTRNSFECRCSATNQVYTPKILSVCGPPAVRR